MRRRKYLILTFCFFCSLSINAQRIETQEVIRVSDSILLANTNERIFACFQTIGGSYYKYQTKNRLATSGFLKKKKLKRNVKEIWVLYSFMCREECVRGGVWVKLDNNLKLIEPLDLDFIPKFVWENRPSDFMTKQKALKQGISYFRNDGIAIWEPELEYNVKLKRYIYRITNVLTKAKDIFTGKDIGNAETAIIDAYSGELLDIQEWTYGLIIR